MNLEEKLDAIEADIMAITLSTPRESREARQKGIDIHGRLERVERAASMLDDAERKQIQERVELLASRLLSHLFKGVR